MPSSREAHFRHAQHYCSILQIANTLHLKGGDQITEGLSIFDREWANILTAYDLVGNYTQKDLVEASLCCAINDAGSHLLDLRQHPHERILWLNTALTAARTLVQDRLMECLFLSNLGAAHLRIRNAREAVKCCQVSLAIAMELKNGYAAAVAVGNLGNAYLQLGNINLAINCFEYDLEVCRQTADRGEDGEALLNLGNAYLLNDNGKDAAECFEQALIASRACGARQNEACALGNLGIVRRQSGDLHKAIEAQKEALELFRAMGDRTGESNALGNLGLVHADLGENENALSYYDEQLAIAMEINDPRAQATAHYNSSLVLHRVGQLSLALDRAVMAQNIYEEIEDAYALRKVRDKLSAWANSAN
jgi:tetratricopeptide (TPR) repeat protein